MEYTDLIFDLYGTLVDIHTDENDLVWEKTAIYFGFYGAHYTAAELRASFDSLLNEKEAEAGQNYECFPDLPIEPVMAELFLRKGVKENTQTLGKNAAQLFRISSMEYIRLYPHVRQVLAALREKGRRLWLLSNAQRVFTEYELRHLGLWDFFDGVYLSSDYGCRKPDIRFFHALLDGEHLDSANCLMIGNDRKTDIAGAKAAGLDTLYLHTNLTPDDQPAADPDRFPSESTRGNWEWEGSDWQALAGVLLSM